VTTGCDPIHEKMLRPLTAQIDWRRQSVKLPRAIRAAMVCGLRSLHFVVANPTRKVFVAPGLRSAKMLGSAVVPDARRCSPGRLRWLTISRAHLMAGEVHFFTTSSRKNANPFVGATPGAIGRCSL
jgi:hypothetical protein